MNSAAIPRLIMTAGEPAGIGPELCLAIAQMDWPTELVICANRDVLEQYQRRLNTDIKIINWLPEHKPQVHQAGELLCYDIPLLAQNTPGELNVANGPYVLKTLEAAANLVLAGRFDAIVTAPVHKGIINDAGIAFSGHTEYFADLAKSDSVMMLACPDFRVALVTTHLPLSKVPEAITDKAITKVVRIIHHDLQAKYGLDNPCIHVCGLNPHAGEGGHLGMEEIEVITPCLESLKSEGFNLVGPLPADTALTTKGMHGADITLAMYHDQGLSVLKYAGFGRAVNVTLGLPFIRVSVDHGTALDLAATGKADSGSLSAAVNEALAMINSKQ